MALRRILQLLDRSAYTAQARCVQYQFKIHFTVQSVLRP